MPFKLKIVLFFSFFVLFCFTLAPGFAQSKVQLDTSAVSVRQMDEDALARLKRDKDFQYEETTEPVQSIWDKFWLWFWSKVEDIMSTKQGRITTWSVLILFAVAAIVFFILKVMGMNKAALFGRTSKESLPYNLSEDDIHNISFEDAITDAIYKGNFRLALRLLYLQSLKNLTDKGYINWQINKTNSDYLVEVSNRSWHSLFKMLTWKFEYTWYGERNINQGDFESLRAQFKQFNTQI